jgi:hypothetical protein
MTQLCHCSLAGVIVRPPGCCHRCGSELATIDIEVELHAAALRCSACSALRGWLSTTTLTFILDTIRQFGVPTDPIIIRRGGVW